MNSKRPNPQNQSQATLSLIAAGTAAILGVALFAVMISSAPMLVRLGLTGHVWYVLLLPLGLSAAVTVFALFKSYARYTGKVLSGTLEVGGPAVVMLAVIALGFFLVSPPPQRFDITVFLHGMAGRQAQVLRNQGHLSLDLGADRRTEPIGDKGEVRFIGIPNDMRDLSVAVSLDATEYELVEPNLELRLDKEVHYVAVRPKAFRLAGAVTDRLGNPLSQARLAIAGRTATTDANGRFEITLQADLPHMERTITVTANGYAPWRAQIVPGGGPLQIQLSETK